MSARPGQPPIPPPPPTLRRRLVAWLWRRDRAGHRRVLILGAAAVSAAAAWLLIGVAGLWLQPRFTVLELSAQRLAPAGPTAQPPQEQVGPNDAFDRGYQVRFETPAGGMPVLLDHARSQRWRVVRRPGAGRVVLGRDGITATLVVDGRVTTAETRVAAWVRTRQRQTRLGGAAIAGLLGGWTVWRVVRRRPRAV